MITSLSPLACTSPDNIRIANRHSRNRRRERDPALVKTKKAWCKGKVCACGCNRPANTAHHPRGELYESDPAYYDPTQWEPYYHNCHRMMHKGFEKCPKCGRWMKPGFEMCWTCRGKPYYGTYRKPSRHPCAKRLRLQVCSDKRICPYSWQKAERQCEHFVKREFKTTTNKS